MKEAMDNAIEERKKTVKFAKVNEDGEEISASSLHTSQSLKSKKHPVNNVEITSTEQAAYDAEQVENLLSEKVWGPDDEDYLMQEADKSKYQCGIK